MINNENQAAAELARQDYYVNKIREFNLQKAKASGHELSAYIHAFGCQMNAHDSEIIESMFTRMGITRTMDENQADYIVYNTCCVRENAENKIYGHLGYLKNYKRQRPHIKIIIGGCMPQQDRVLEKIKSSYRHVDVIFGTFNVHRLPELIYMNHETGDMIIDIWKEHEGIIEGLPAIRESKVKASVNIMYGCDNFCSYCIVPYVRGRERSREAVEVLREVRELAADGVKEVMLLGQNVNSYGRGLNEKMNFAELLRHVDAVTGIERIRFMTSHPKDLSDDLIDAMAECEHVCKHLHLPVQSGSNRVLNQMNRKYTRERYLSLIETLKIRIPGILISTDIIVGFPGETEEDFLETLSLVQKVGFSNAYTFEYSPRAGTLAAEFGEPVKVEIVKERFKRLLDVLGGISLELNKGMIGTVQKVLIDEVKKNADDSSTSASGRTGGNCIVHCDAGENHIGQIVDVFIDNCTSYYLSGKIRQ